MAKTFDPAKLTEARQAVGMSRYQLARLLNKTYQCIYGWELGQSEPRGSDLALMAQALGVPMDHFFTEASDEAPLSS